MSSLVARKNSALRTDRQGHLENIFSTKPNNIFAPGDRVLIKNRKKHFDKFNPIDFPSYAPGIFTIRTADFTTYPALYSLVEFSDTRRRLYGWEMYKLDSSFDRTAQRHETQSPQNQILVHDVILTDKSTLRSGKIIPGKGNLNYQVSRQGKKEIIDAYALAKWKKNLGQNLVYGPNFAQPEKAQYKI